MKVPLQISSRRVSLSEAAHEAIRKKAEKLEEFCKDIISCRVMVEAPHKRRHHGDAYNVRLDLSVPGNELVVTHEPAEDIYVAIRDAFSAARRQLQAFSRKRRGEVKVHHEVENPLAKVARIFKDQGFGFLETKEGREIYFHSNSVHGRLFEELKIGLAVRFAEEQGALGPQARTVAVVT